MTSRAPHAKTRPEPLVRALNVFLRHRKVEDEDVASKERVQAYGDAFECIQKIAKKDYGAPTEDALLWSLAAMLWVCQAPHKARWLGDDEDAALLLPTNIRPTLWSFISTFSPEHREMCHAMCRDLGFVCPDSWWKEYNEADEKESGDAAATASCAN